MPFWIGFAVGKSGVRRDAHSSLSTHEKYSIVVCFCGSRRLNIKTNFEVILETMILAWQLLWNVSAVLLFLLGIKKKNNWYPLKQWTIPVLGKKWAGWSGGKCSVMLCKLYDWPFKQKTSYLCCQRFGSTKQIRLDNYSKNFLQIPCLLAEFPHHDQLPW